MDDRLACDNNQLCRYRKNRYRYSITCVNISVTTIDLITTCLREKFSNDDCLELELANCSLTTLPINTFRNVCIFEFHSTCPFSDVTTDALYEMKHLHLLTLLNSTFTNLPSDLPRLVNLMHLKMITHKVKSLNTASWSFPSLLGIILNHGELEELPKDAFVGIPNLWVLNLRNNRLSYLHDDTFKMTKSLQLIILEGNNLHTVDGLFDTIFPEVINLSDNNLTSVDNVFGRPMPTLRRFMIAKNPIQSISFKLASVAPYLYEFDMRETGCRKLNSNFFHMSRNLSILNLSHNSLEMSLDFHSLFSAVSINLNHNCITSIEGLFLYNIFLNSLSLSHNNISEIKDSVHILYSLTILDISHNVVKYLSNDNFIDLKLLKTLDLSWNRIEYIESKSFSKLRNLEFLSLAGNRFTTLNSSLQNLFALKTLLLNSTRLEILEDDEFLGLAKLSYLNLESNRIKFLKGAFQGLLSLEILNIAKNSLVTLSRNNFPQKVVLKTLWVSGSKQLHCDCRMMWLIQWLSEANYTTLKDNPICSFPVRLRGKEVKKLALNDVAEWPESCPYPCYCECDSQGDELWVKADCSNRNLSLVPEFFPDNVQYLNLSGNELGPSISLTYNWTYNLIVLDLEQNNITNLDWDIPGRVEELKLAGNLIKRFPWSKISNASLRVLTLADNPWICDCETVNFRKWLLSESNSVIDINETKCGPDGPLPDLYGKIITSIKDTDLCPSIISVYITIAMGITGFLVMAISMRLAYSKYHLYIKVWLYAHGYTWVKEDDMDTEKPFDAMVSYHHSAEAFVFGELATRLEQEDPRFILCIPERDILCGEFFATAEMNAVKDSKRIIVVLNEEYVNDMYCMSIFHYAFRQTLKDKVQRVILIKMCDITESEASEDMLAELKVALESSNCISLDIQLFWERLRYAMPKKTRNPREGRCYQVHPINTEE